MLRTGAGRALWAEPECWDLALDEGQHSEAASPSQRPKAGQLGPRALCRQAPVRDWQPEGGGMHEERGRTPTQVQATHPSPARPRLQPVPRVVEPPCAGTRTRGSGHGLCGALTTAAEGSRYPACSNWPLQIILCLMHWIARDCPCSLSRRGVRESNTTSNVSWPLGVTQAGLSARSDSQR